MSEQIVPPQQPFQGQTPYNRPPLPNQQPPQAQQGWSQAGNPQQSGTHHGFPQQSYPQQEQWGQPPTSQYRNSQQSRTNPGYPQQEQWGQPPVPQYGYSQQTQYSGQFAQNNVHTPPQFQQVTPKTSKSDFLKKKLAVPVWGIIVAIVLFVSVFATSVYALGNKSNSPNPSVSTSSTTSNNSMGQTNSAPNSVPTSAPTTIPAFAPTPISTSGGPSKIGGTITTIDGLACTLISVQPIQSDNITYPKVGDTFIVVHVKMANNSNSDYYYINHNFQVISGSGNGTDSIVPPSTYTANNYITSGTLIPNGTVQGDLIFEVSSGDHKAELSWQPDPRGSVAENVWNLGL